MASTHGERDVEVPVPQQEQGDRSRANIDRELERMDLVIAGPLFELHWPYILRFAVSSVLYDGIGVSTPWFARPRVRGVNYILLVDVPDLLEQLKAASYLNGALVNTAFAPWLE